MNISFSLQVGNISMSVEEIEELFPRLVVTVYVNMHVK